MQKDEATNLDDSCEANQSAAMPNEQERQRSIQFAEGTKEGYDKEFGTDEYDPDYDEGEIIPHDELDSSDEEGSLESDTDTVGSMDTKTGKEADQDKVQELPSI